MLAKYDIVEHSVLKVSKLPQANEMPHNSATDNGEGKKRGKDYAQKSLNFKLLK